jgi:MFS family permease
MERKTIIKLSVVFALVYFFSTNGMASLPGLTINYLLKDVLKMTASQASYFSAVTMLAWLVKPLWGIISDVFPIFGYRRKPWLMITASGGAAVWFWLGATPSYTVEMLLAAFTLSAMFYAFNDVAVDGLMVETGKPYGLTGKFQAVQWTAVYLASIIVGVTGGLVAEYFSPQTTFTINGLFPLIVLLAIILFISEEKALSKREQVRTSLRALKEAMRERKLWLVAFFMFFWTFSPSYGMPFFYFATNTLKFGKMFLGTSATISSIGSLLGALLYWRYGSKIGARKVLYASIALGAVAALSDLLYFTPFMLNSFYAPRAYALAASFVLGILTGFSGLTVLNIAAIVAPKYSEGTVFAALTSFWNIGLSASAAAGGFLFDLIGLQPLIIVSAATTALAALVVPLLKLDN